jgi:UDP-N-acetylmuramoyl-L-alanyl-D-glutamate--2,6-diaminopimelate ligase
LAQFAPQSIEKLSRVIGITNSTSELLANLKISGVAYDSRLVEAGDAFICIPGQHVDGNKYIQEALERGAACIVSENPDGNFTVPYLKVPDVRLAMAVIADHCYDYPSQKLRPLGITGTNGKTTVTHLVEHIFRSNGRAIGLIGTLGSRWKGLTGYLEIKHTTPQSSDLHRLLDAMVEAGCSHVAMEVSSHALEQKRVAGCHFALACLTNVSQDHLDFTRPCSTTGNPNESSSRT